MHIFDVRVRNSVRIQPFGNEDLMLASDSASWRSDASLVQVVLVGGFHPHRSMDVFGDCGKFIVIISTLLLVKLTAGN
jgi:hypothetical protein